MGDKRVNKVYIDEEKYVYVISKEDLILDRLRAAVNWKSEEDALWGFRLYIRGTPLIHTMVCGVKVLAKCQNLV